MDQSGGRKRSKSERKRRRKKALKAVGKTALKAGKFIKKQRLVSKGLKALAPAAGEFAPGVLLAGETAGQLGFGKPRKQSAWIDHVKAYRAKHPGMSYGEALSKASPSYKKGQSGGALQLAGRPSPRRKTSCRPCKGQRGGSLTLPGQGGGAISGMNNETTQFKRPQ